MVCAAVGVALFVLGVIVGRSSPRMGTALAGALVLAWFGLLAVTGLTGDLDGPQVQDLAALLVVGLIAFLIGSNITSRPTSSRRPR